jgi:hypothetical protein
MAAVARDRGYDLATVERPLPFYPVRECCLHASRGIGSAGGDTLSPLREVPLTSRSRVAT